jgi:hypothetical protein
MAQRAEEDTRRTEWFYARNFPRIFQRAIFVFFDMITKDLKAKDRRFNKVKKID